MHNYDHPNRFTLYAVSAERQVQYAGDPPLREDLLNCRNMLAADRLASIAFSLAEPPRLHWDAASGWLEWPKPLTPTLFCGAQDFLSAVPDLQSWVDAWSASAAKRPDLAPKWATVRELHETTVAYFAEALERHLAGPKRCAIKLCNRVNEVVLTLPARTALSLPPTLPGRDATILVRSMEPTNRLLLPNGSSVYVPSPALESDYVPRIDPRQLRKQPIFTVSGVGSTVCNHAQEMSHA